MVLAASCDSAPLCCRGQEVSKYNLDGSQRATDLVDEHFQGNWMEMLGQLQLSFILFLAISVTLDHVIFFHLVSSHLDNSRYLLVLGF